MKDESIYKIVKKLGPEYQSFGNSLIFDAIFRKFIQENKLFFEHFPDKEFSKLFSMAYFLWIENPDYTLEEIQKLLPNTGLVSTYSNDYESVKETCDECDGEGDLECENCEGGGEVECPVCDGEGVDAEGDTCGECDGSRYVECTWCWGRGEENCDRCDGTGEIEDDSEVFVFRKMTFFSKPGLAEYFEKASQKNLNVEDVLPSTTINEGTTREYVMLLDTPSGEEILVKDVIQDPTRMGKILKERYLGNRERMWDEYNI